MGDFKKRVELSLLREQLGLPELPIVGSQVCWSCSGYRGAAEGISIDAYLEGIGDGVFAFTLIGFGGVQGRFSKDEKAIEIDSRDAAFLDRFAESVSKMDVVEGEHDG